MRDILLELINNDTSYNKNISRYLYRTHPDLWKQILDKTSFLPDNALPKQRIWHILNDIWERPICPETGQFTKWWENRYLTFISLSAKASYQNKQGIYKNQTDEVNRKRSQSNKQTRKIRKVKNRGKATEEEILKRHKTNLEKYGNIHPTKTLEFRKYLSDIQIKNGATPRDQRPLRQLYYDEVKRVTKDNWNEHFDKINPNRLNRSQFDLDHIYSIQQGFLDNIPPYIIGHWTNLRMIIPTENYSKGMRCDKTKDQLFEDYFVDFSVKHL